MVLIAALAVVSTAHAQNTGFARNADRPPSGGTVKAPAKAAPRKPGPSSTGDALMELGNRLLEIDRNQQAAEQRKRKAGVTIASTAANGCASALDVGGAMVSVMEPIAANGSAQAALDGARAYLRALDAQGPCSQYGDADGCELDRRSWTEMVRALECHAAAGSRDAAATAKSPKPAAKSPQQAAKDGADSLLDMVDTPGAPGAKATAGVGAAPSQGRTGSGRPAQRSAKLAPFPTPRCKYVSDPEHRHDARRYVCHAGAVYECRDRTAATGRDAWALVTTQQGCGNVRDIVAVEREFLDLVDVSDNLYEKE